MTIVMRQAECDDGNENSEWLEPNNELLREKDVLG